MTTAISYVSESGDHYLSLFPDNDLFWSMLRKEREKFGDEFKYLYVLNVETAGTGSYSPSIIKQCMSSAISATK
jgi:hypothetical protein